MDPKTLFKPGLTIPEHESRDLHYIGEALPVPSLITASISVATDSTPGGSPIPAREDHTHAIDVQSLIDYINNNPGLIDLSNYYTKAEVDALIAAVDGGGGGDTDLSNYYTKAEIDNFLNILAGAIDDANAEINNLYGITSTLNANIAANTADINTLFNIANAHQIELGNLQDQIDAIPAYTLWFEFFWSYGLIVNPSADVFLNRYVAFQNMSVTQIEITLSVASGTSIVVDWWVDNSGSFHLEDTITLSAGSLRTQRVVSTPVHLIPTDEMYFGVRSNPSGTGEKLTISTRGFYDP